MAQAVAREFSDDDGPSVEGSLSDIIRSALESHLDAQGSSLDALQRRLAGIAAAPRRVIVAEASGILDVDLGRIRAAIVRLQASGGVQFNDPAGIELLVRQTAVNQGDQVALLRCENESDFGDFASEIGEALIVEPDKTINDPEVQEMEMIRA